jgi:hypothetical protein
MRTWLDVHQIEPRLFTFSTAARGVVFLLAVKCSVICDPVPHSATMQNQHGLNASRAGGPAHDCSRAATLVKVSLRIPDE